MKISCVMAIGQRPHFLPQALRCFSQQTYEDRELILVDDGNGEAPEIDDARVRYLRLPCRTPTGAKYNAGFAAATGELFQKLDDDDYYGRQFLEIGVARLRKARSTKAIAAWGRFHILLLHQLRLYDSGPGWFAGGTLLFHRQAWEEVPFRPIPKDEDARFLEDHEGGPRIAIHNAKREYVLVRHGKNTWNRFTNGARVDPYFTTFTPARLSLQELVHHPEFYTFLSSRNMSK